MQKIVHHADGLFETINFELEDFLSVVLFSKIPEKVIRCGAPIKTNNQQELIEQ